MWRERRSRFAAVALGGAMLASSAVSPASGQEISPFGEGHWVGTLVYVGGVELGGVPVFYRASGSFEFASDGSAVDGTWDLNITSVPDGGAPASGYAWGPAEGVPALVDLDLTAVSVRDSITGMELTFTADELPTSGAGALYPKTRECSALVGDWQIPFDTTVLEGSFIANAAASGSAGPIWQELQAEGIQLLTELGEPGGEMNLEAVRNYLRSAEAAMWGTTGGSEGCSAETLQRFNSAAIAMADSMLSTLASRVKELTDDELEEMVRFGYRSGAFSHYDIETPFLREMQQRMTDAWAARDVDAMEWWLPLAWEFGYDAIAENLLEAIEEERD